jgi:hypothetical protein
MFVEGTPRLRKCLCGASMLREWRMKDKKVPSPSENVARMAYVGQESAYTKLYLARYTEAIIL